MDLDDVFYAQLETQILQLMAGDEEDDIAICSYKHSKSRYGRKRELDNGYTAAKQVEKYFDWTKDESSESVPSWLLNLWRPNSNGTGVFIPQIVKSRTKHNKPRRRNNDKRKGLNKPLGSSKELVI